MSRTSTYEIIQIPAAEMFTVVMYSSIAGNIILFSSNKVRSKCEAYFRHGKSVFLLA